MLRNILILPDGTELFSGTGTTNAIKSVTLTECVNCDEELTLGSTCANMIEAQLFTPNGGLLLTAGDEVTLYKVDDEDTRHKVGVFILEKPTRTTANTMKLTGYDRVTRLDKDLTTWLGALTGWPYNILTFASMVCGACGLSFIPGEVPNKDFSVEKFSTTGITGRQLMKWIGEATCSFCRANADGKIELGWYAPLTTQAIGWQSDQILYDKYIGDLSFKSAYVEMEEGSDGEVKMDSDYFAVTDDGEGNVVLALREALPYFQNGLAYEEYSVLPVDAVQIQLGAGDDAYRWPAVAEDANTYIISGNPLLQSASDAMRGVLNNILERLSSVTYTPCKVSLTATMNISAGDTISLTDKNGKTIMIYVMTATTAGQKLTVECTGSHRRDSTTAQNNQSVSQIAQNVAQNVAADAAKQAVDGQTQQDIFNKLTENGKLQGLYMKDGQLYINASYLMSGIIDAAVVQVVNLIAEKLRSVAGNAELNVDGAELRFLLEGNETIMMASSAMPILFMTDYEGSAPTNHCEMTPHHLKLGGTSVQPVFEIQTLSGGPKLNLASTGYKTLSWKDNGDGTFALIGT